MTYTDSVALAHVDAKTQVGGAVNFVRQAGTRRFANELVERSGEIPIACYAKLEGVVINPPWAWAVGCIPGSAGRPFLSWGIASRSLQARGRG